MVLLTVVVLVASVVLVFCGCVFAVLLVLLSLRAVESEELDALFVFSVSASEF